jgi:phospholipid/cholesterol/gamma-HCH transport system substrate-binding protein
MAERRMRLRLGLFMASSLAALAGLVVLFGGTPSLFSNKTRYTVTYPEAPGIAPGTPIRKSGVRIGEVTALDLDPETGMVRVRIAVDPKYPPRTSEGATITRGLLSGDTAIDFLPKLGPDGQPVPRGDPYPPGSEIAGIPPITPRAIATTAQQSLEKISASFEKFERMAPKIESAADEIALLARDVRLAIPELLKTNEKIQRLIGDANQPDQDPNTIKALVAELRETLRAVRPTIDVVGRMVERLEPELVGAARSARQTFDAARPALDAINDVLSPENRKQIAELLKNLNLVAFNVIKLAASLSTLSDEAEKTLVVVRKQVEAVGGVIADVRTITKPLAERADQLVKDVSESATQLNLVLRDVREVVRLFARSDGTLQKLLTDPNLYQNLDAAALALAKVLARADKIGKDLEVFADKVARRPELIGLGGLAKPSSGLKDSPFAPQVPCYRPDWPPAIPAMRPSGPAWLPPEPPPPIQGLPPRP